MHIYPNLESLNFFIYYFAGVYEGSITELPNILND